jgi:hypothetical protein
MKKMEDFRNSLSLCHLSDMGFFGPRFMVRVLTTRYVDFKFISFTTRNITNQLYYSKSYRTTRIEGLFCVTRYLKERI